MIHIHIRFFLFSIFLIFSAFRAFTQNSADDYFRAEQFAQAAKMFEKQVDKKKNWNTVSKLAYCYRMTNRYDKAFDLYRKIVSQERAKTENFFYFAEMLIQKEQYDSAAIWLKRYLESNPKDELGAKNALDNLSEIQKITPYFPDSQLLSFSQNSEVDDNSPMFFRRKIVFTSDRALGFRMLKEKSGATGRDFLNIYSADIQGDTIFAKADNFSGQLNQKNGNNGAASFTSDGKYVYFEQNSTKASKSGAYNLQLFRAEVDGKGWKNVEKLSFCNEELNFMHPAISPDGSELFFVSNNPTKGTDLYYTRLTANGNWRAMENLGETINTTTSEGFPFMDNAGRLYFASKGHAGYGGFDLFVTERDEVGNWKKPTNLGKPINSSLDDISFVLFRNGVSGAFSSARDGGDDDIYFFKHKDSTYYFDKEQVIAIEAESIVVKKDTIIEPQTPKAAMSIDAPTHIVAPEIQLDLCLALHYCTLGNLYEKLATLADTTQEFIDSSFLKKSYIVENIRFQEVNLSKDTLCQNQLDSLYNMLKTNRLKVQFLIHTTTKGKEKDNLELSKKQGLRLVKTLMEKGIPREQIRSKGMGETTPLCEGNTCAPFGKNEDELNARVEMKILGFF